LEPMACLRLDIQPLQVRRMGFDGLAFDLGYLAQACEIQQGDFRHHDSPKSRLPPRLPTNLAGPMTIRCESAVHMSYTVSAATVARVSASISTPVRCVVLTAHSIFKALSPSQAIPKRQPSIGKGWQKGISSWVRFAARVPAMIAVSTMPP